MKHILLIDDNEIDNYINKLTVTQANIAELITVKDSAIDALEYLTDLVAAGQPFPELIFLDVQMPEMDGFQFLDKYADFPEEVKQKTVINMLTSSNNPDDIKRAGDCIYVKHFFNKPMTTAMLEGIKINLL